MVCTLANSQEVSLAPLWDVELLVKPGENVLDWPVFSHRLALGQSGKQKAELLESDAYRSALLAVVTKRGGPLRP